MSGHCVSTACALLIGNELLNGSIGDCNLVELARTLHGLGIRLQRALILPDQVETLSLEIRAASQQYDVVFTSGGIGPTHDDMTISAVAHAFGVETVVNEELHRALIDHYGDTLGDAHVRLALVPAGAHMMKLPHTKWPTIVMRNVWILPGVPAIFQAKLEAVRHFLKGPVTYHCSAVMCRSDEIMLKQFIDLTVQANLDVEIGSYPLWPPAGAQTKVTFETTDPKRLRQAVDQFIEMLPNEELMSVVE